MDREVPFHYILGCIGAWNLPASCPKCICSKATKPWANHTAPHARHIWTGYTHGLRWQERSAGSYLTLLLLPSFVGVGQGKAGQVSRPWPECYETWWQHWDLGHHSQLPLTSPHPSDTLGNHLGLLNMWPNGQPYTSLQKSSTLFSKGS